ncbi:MAG: hypothetical protein A4S09_07895 [Proteobacteria bacterium SG_bin7]|nr:MAG: hypothetical protein A4S09_07895 [Proteobacteria bacterium SG_bin7]
MNNTVFDYDDYKDFLRDLCNERPKGFVSQLAKAANCQRSYISQALNSHIQLTPDHVHGINSFLGLRDSESDMLLLLLERSRCASASYREKINEKIRNLSKVHNRLSQRVKDNSSKISDEAASNYYSSWHFAAIHIATSSTILNTQKEISKYLGLPEEIVGKALNQLKSWGLVDLENEKWIYKKGISLHLEDNSPYNRSNHANWRIRALANPMSDTSIHYSSVFTISSKDVPKLRKQILDLIEEQRKQIQKSGSEDVVSFCCDFFVPAT